MRWGALINTLAVIFGGVLGLMIGSKLKRRFQDILMCACGVAVIFIGIAGALQGLLTVSSDGRVISQNTVLLVFSLVIGGLVGEIVNIEKAMEALGNKLKKLAHADGDNSFAEGFIDASLIICVGAMAICGSIEDGINVNPGVLVTKSILDLIIVMIFASTKGIGAVFSAIPLFIYQGSITLAAYFAGSFMPEALTSLLSFVGSVLIFCIGINLVFGKKIKTGNLLPALLVPVFYYLFTLI